MKQPVTADASSRYWIVGSAVFSDQITICLESESIDVGCVSIVDARDGTSEIVGRMEEFGREFQNVLGIVTL